MKKGMKIMLALMLSAGAAHATYVPIGNAGNADDTTGYGGVGYDYKISDHEVTIAEFNASGAGDGDEGYWNDGTRTVGPNAPATFVSLYEARMYCNWLNTGDVDKGYYGKGGEEISKLSHIDYATANGPTYFVPTEDEWYKAAHYTGSGYSLYSNGTGTAPVEGGGATGWNYNTVNSSPNYTRDTALGTTEQNGTVNMMGNVFEWMEDSAGVIRGGNCFDDETYLLGRNLIGSIEKPDIGFRTVEVIPEPATIGLLALMGCGVVFIRRTFMI